jgi:RND superfamily putative drug exporter
VIVSGSTVAVGLVSMVLLPLPFIRSIGIGGMLIPAVSVITAITLLPALLATLGTRINSLRLLPKRFVDRGHPEDGPWGRWADFVMRRPLPIFLIGVVIVALVIYPAFHMNPSDAQLKNEPASGDAEAGAPRSPRLGSGRRVPPVCRPAGRSQAIAGREVTAAAT